MKSKGFYKSVCRASLLLVIGLALLPAISVAQQYYDPGLIQKTIVSKPGAYQSPGIRMGSFLLSTGAELTWENKDNIFYLADQDVGDNIYHLRPWLALNSDWSRHQLNFNAYADIGRFKEFDSEDYEDWQLSLDGRIDVKYNSAFNYEAAYMQLHEERSSPDDVGGIHPTVFIFSGFGLGYTHTFNRLTSALNYDRYKTDYDDNLELDGEIVDNQDRDRTRDGLMLRMDYRMTGEQSIFFAIASNSIEYDQPINHQGHSRSSDGYDLQAGVAFSITSLLIGDLFLQYMKQDYDDPDFDSVSGWGIGAELSWMPTEVTIVSFRFATSPQETTQADSSGYLSSLYSVRVQHELRRNLLGHLRLSYTDNNYQNNNAGEDSLSDTGVLRAGIGLSYLINRHFDISGGYVYEKQTANLTSFDYTANRWFITLGFVL